MLDLLMLWDEAIRLGSPQEQSHGCIISTDLVVAATHARRHGMRKLCDQTQAGYIRAVRQLAAFLKRSPDSATVEDLRRFQLHLVDRGTSPITLNATITGMTFFFDITLDRGELLGKMQPVRIPRTLPVVLSREEVARLIAATLCESRYRFPVPCPCGH